MIVLKFKKWINVNNRGIALFTNKKINKVNNAY